MSKIVKPIYVQVMIQQELFNPLVPVPQHGPKINPDVPVAGSSSFVSAGSVEVNRYGTVPRYGLVFTEFRVADQVHFRPDPDPANQNLKKPDPTGFGSATLLQVTVLISI